MSLAAIMSRAIVPVITTGAVAALAVPQLSRTEPSGTEAGCPVETRGGLYFRQAIISTGSLALLGALWHRVRILNLGIDPGIDHLGPLRWLAGTVGVALLIAGTIAPYGDGSRYIAPYGDGSR